MMSNISFKAALVALFAIGLCAGAQAAQKPMKAFHKTLSCEACYGEAAPVAPVKTQCTGCHGSPEQVARSTASKYKRYYNPHDSLHYSTYADCVLCHREHQPSRLDCNNSRCHGEFKYVVP